MRETVTISGVSRDGNRVEIEYSSDHEAEVVASRLREKLTEEDGDSDA